MKHFYISPDGNTNEFYTIVYRNDSIKNLNQFGETKQIVGTCTWNNLIIALYFFFVKGLNGELPEKLEENNLFY